MTFSFISTNSYFVVLFIAVNSLFSIAGILYSLGFSNYLSTITLWKIYKICSIVFLIVFLFKKEISVSVYFMLAPIDFFITLYLFMLPNSSKSQEYDDKISQ